MPLFIIFRSVRKKLQLTVSFDHPVFDSCEDIADGLMILLLTDITDIKGSVDSCDDIADAVLIHRYNGYYRVSG